MIFKVKTNSFYEEKVNFFLILSYSVLLSWRLDWKLYLLLQTLKPCKNCYSCKKCSGYPTFEHKTKIQYFFQSLSIRNPNKAKSSDRASEEDFDNDPAD